MPSTITTYYTFQPATKARSSQVNTNFSNYRGDLLPINEATVSASDNVHNLGAADHRWNTAHLSQIQFSSATTTATCVAKTDTSAAAGAFTWEIEGTEVARLAPNGFSIESLQTAAVQVIAVTITSNTTWSIPAYVGNMWAEACGGGGGGGYGVAGAPDAGGGGGGAAPIVTVYFNVSGATVLSITVGSAGAGGVGTSGSNGTESMIRYVVGGATTTYFFLGGGGGGMGNTTGNGSLAPGGSGVSGGGGGGSFGIGGNGTAGSGTAGFNGGGGGGGGTTGGVGGKSIYCLTAAAGSFGGGGGSGYYIGGAGGPAGAFNTIGADAPTANSGAGGGGGAVNKNGGKGADGRVTLFYVRTR